MAANDFSSSGNSDRTTPPQGGKFPKLAPRKFADDDDLPAADLPLAGCRSTTCRLRPCHGKTSRSKTCRSKTCRRWSSFPVLGRHLPAAVVWPAVFL